MANIRFIQALLSLMLIAIMSISFAKPVRIVSMNLCTDQLLMLLVARKHIAAVSYLAIDPHSSAMAEQAVGLTINYGQAEEILSLAPDLILAGTFTTRPTVFLLQKLGYPVVELPVANNLPAIRNNIRIVAKAVGEIKRGETLIIRFDRQLTALTQSLMIDQPTVKPLAVLYWANSYTSGIGTLANAVLEVSGLTNFAVQLEIHGTRQLSLEGLLMAQPDVLIAGRIRENEPALANEIFRHPALRQAFAHKPLVRIADYLWVCGTPFIIEAITQLVEVRQQWLAAQK